MTRDKEEKTLRDALLRRRLKEIAELAEADPLYGVSREEPCPGIPSRGL